MEATASVINILQITGTFIEYLRAAKHANSDRRKLLLEANSLSALLISLRDFVELEEHDFPDWRRAIRHLEAPDGPFAQYHTEMTDLVGKLMSQHRVQKAVQVVMWKMTKEDVNEAHTRLDRLKSLILIALEMDHTRLSEAILAAVNDVNTTAGLIRSDTLRLVNSVDEAAFRSLLDQICVEDYASVFQSNITEHTADVGQNFISSPEFKDWASFTTTSSTLLCVGDPGVGKTVLATKAIQTLRKRKGNRREAVLFVYCDCTRRRSRINRRDSSPEARSKGVQTPGHFLASLLRQLVAANGSQTTYLQEMMARHDKQKTKPKLSELEQAFANVAKNFDRVYIVVDALDECDSLEMETFASRLLSICSAAPLRLLLTSRRQPQIEQVFEESTRLDMRAYDHDTLQYLRSRAKREFPPRVSRDHVAMERILNALLLSANGIPLIARLHMNALGGVRTPGAMLATISKLQASSDVYDETYHAAMERIMKQPGELPAMAMRVIRWIVCAKRYIYAREIQCILAMADDSESLDEDYVPDMEDVFLACEGLVCVVSDGDTDSVRLELVHTTARNYFDTQLARWAPDVSLDLARTCLNLLAFTDASLVPLSLMSYALRYWGEHAKDVELQNEDEQFGALLPLARRLLTGGEVTNDSLSHPITINESYQFLVDKGLTGYHLVAKFGLIRLFKAFYRSSDDLDSMADNTEYGLTPLLVAACYERVEIIRAMLDHHNVDTNARNAVGRCSLEVAIISQHPSVVEVLLQDGVADPNGVDQAGRPLTLLAASLGEERSLELLLSSPRMDADFKQEHGPSLVALVSLKENERSSLEDMSLQEVKQALSPT